MYFLPEEFWVERDRLHKLIGGDPKSTDGHRPKNGNGLLTEAELEQKRTAYRERKAALDAKIAKGKKILGHLGGNFALCAIDSDGIHEVITFGPTIDDPQILAKQEEFRDRETFIRWMPTMEKRPREEGFDY